MTQAEDGMSLFGNPMVSIASNVYSERLRCSVLCMYYTNSVFNPLKLNEFSGSIASKQQVTKQAVVSCIVLHAYGQTGSC